MSKILKQEEETQRLKSLIVWLSNGDNNTIFSQNYANQKKNCNAIWDLKDLNGNILMKQRSMEVVGVSHCKEIYNQNDAINLEDQLKFLIHYPVFINSEEGAKIGEAVFIQEVKSVLKQFSKEKILGPNGWQPTELFLHFFDTVGQELVNIVEESINLGKHQREFEVKNGPPKRCTTKI